MVKTAAMKKIFIILAVAAAAVACIKEEMTAPSYAEGQTIFTGEFLNTKIALGDKENGVYPAEWEADDQLAIYDAASNTLLGTAALTSESVGQRMGTFVLNQTIADGTKVKVVYPATEISGVAAEQTKASAADKHLIAKAESKEITIQNQQAAFALTHKNAIVKVDVNSSEFAGKLLKSVTIYSAGAVIANDSDYARVTFTAPAAVSAGETQSAVFMTLPVTTDTDFYVSVKLVDAQDELRTISIPKKFTAKQLMAGQVNTIPFKNLATSDNVVAWYNPECNRYIPEGGWCYGTSNTFVCNPTDGASGTFDVRAQGEFIDVIRYAKEPKGMQLRCGNMQKTGQGKMWTVDGTTPSKKGIAPLNSLNPTIKYNFSSNSVTNFVSGVFNLCDANDQVIWSYLCWAATINTVELDNGTIMDTNLGFGGTMVSDANKLSDQGVYYQWGRPFAFGYPSSADGQTVNADLRIMSYQQSAENAMSMGCTTDENNRDWWQDGTHRYDLWGNPETTTTSTGGKKSIFDPCPTGWKVASAALLKEVYDNATDEDGDMVYTYKGSQWSKTYFFNGNNASRGSAKGLYWADSAVNDNYGLHYEIFPETVKDGVVTAPAGKKFDGTWRANACAIRCMKDNDNR